MLLKLSLIAVLGCLVLADLSFAACPTIVSRSEWGARSPRSNITAMKNPVSYAVIHHSATIGGVHCTTKTDCIIQVKIHQNRHMNRNGWSDIGYSFIVGEDGNIYEGRGWSKVGYHSPAFDSDSIGILIMGSYTSKLPNDLAVTAAKNLIKCGVEKGYIKAAYQLKGHRDGNAGQCPGNTLYAALKGWDNFVAGTSK